MTPIEAASVLLTRGDEVYFVTRAATLRFMGGMVAFPGGKIDPDDATLAARFHLSPRHLTAVRELFEETGVLLVADLTAHADDLAHLREQLLAQVISFGQVLDRLGCSLRYPLEDVGRLVTPPFVPTRFDTQFYLAQLPAGQEPSIRQGELVAGDWLTPTSALSRWREGQLLLSPPTVSILQCLDGQSVQQLACRLQPLLTRLDSGEIPPIWSHPSVLLIPLDCQGLPPTTHTNCWVVGTDTVYVIDPGPVDPDEQAKLWRSLDRLPRLDGILVSHHHPDHIGAVRECAKRYQIPILAHERTAELLAGKISVDRLLEDNDILDLGMAPHRRSRWALQVLLTPGHAPGHLAFFEETYGLLFAGDMVSPLSSMIIAPHDGDLVEYLRSLERLTQLPTRLLLPAHGGPTVRAAHMLGETIKHRHTREQQLLEALQTQPHSIAELALQLYRGYPETVLQLARLQIETGLRKLQQEGRVRVEADRWLAEQMQ
jgi:glyoxylase-like metal-dependent hydrolase (beta-lactamase superfamily II)/8-oxo-dGTP pyrophosphatase MutT (NUDIX family)